MSKNKLVGAIATAAVFAFMTVPVASVVAETAPANPQANTGSKKGCDCNCPECEWGGGCCLGSGKDAKKTQN